MICLLNPFRLVESNSLGLSDSMNFVETLYWRVETVDREMSNDLEINVETTSNVAFEDSFNLDLEAKVFGFFDVSTSMKFANNRKNDRKDSKDVTTKLRDDSNSLIDSKQVSSTFFVVERGGGGESNIELISH